MSERDEIQCKVPASKIEGLRRLRPSWRTIPAVYIVNMVLDQFIEDETRKEKP